MITTSPAGRSVARGIQPNSVVMSQHMGYIVKLLPCLSLIRNFRGYLLVCGTFQGEDLTLSSSKAYCHLSLS